VRTGVTSHNYAGYSNEVANFFENPNIVELKINIFVYAQINRAIIDRQSANRPVFDRTNRIIIRMNLDG
jgi:hypothetical protein